MNELLKSIRWRRHSFGLGLLLTSISVCAISVWLYFERQDAMQQAQRRYQQQRSINLNAEAALEQINTHQEEYEALQARGIIGSAHRLQWIEVLYRIGNEYWIPKVDYTLETANRIEEFDDVYYHADIPLTSTRMRLELEMMHEYDVYTLLHILHREGEGVFSVERCELRATPPVADRPFDPRFKGTCLLLWYNLADITEAWPSHEGAEHVSVVR